MTEASEKILELANYGDRAVDIVKALLADRERLIEALKDIFETDDHVAPTIIAADAINQSAQTNEEILGERE